MEYPQVVLVEVVLGLLLEVLLYLPVQVHYQDKQVVQDKLDLRLVLLGTAAEEEEQDK